MILRYFIHLNYVTHCGC